MDVRSGYPSDLSDPQWVLIEPFLQAWKAKRPSPSGHEGRYEMRAIVNAIFYQNRTGCQLMYLPTTCHPGQRSTATSGCGATTAPTRRNRTRRIAAVAFTLVLAAVLLPEVILEGGGWRAWLGTIAVIALLADLVDEVRNLLREKKAAKQHQSDWVIRAWLPGRSGPGSRLPHAPV